MPIVFFENFENDTLESLPLRYPGTVHGQLGTPVPNCFPLQRTAGNTGAAYDAIFNMGAKVENPERIDLFLGLEDNGNTATTHQNCFLVFFNNLVVHGSSATSFQVYPIGSGTTINVPVPNLKSVREIYLRIDYSSQTLFAIVDGDIAANRVPIDWTFVPSDINNLIIDASNTSIQNQWFPNMLRSLVVATDMPADQLLDPSSIQFVHNALSVANAGDWQYTDTGYVEDTDKATPLEELPGAFVVDEGPIEYQITEVPDTLSTKVYAGVRTDQQMWVEVGYEGGQAVKPTMNPTVVPPVEPFNRTSLVVNVTSSQPWISNGLGMEWGGEVDLISYAELSSRLGVTAGVQMADNSWLRVRLDGREMYVAKTPVRYNISWSQIYSFGLVYGTDDDGLFPEGSPSNQLRTVEIGGRLYKVRLLRGADTDPYGGAVGNDMEGTRNSEWSRILYPLSSTVVASYTGPLLSNYSNTDLGVGGSLVGRGQWCMEHYDATNLVIRGLNTLPHITGSLSTNSGQDRGWRPVLELVV